MTENDSKQTSPSLLVRLRDTCDQDAWKRFMETYTPLVYGYCRRRGFQEADSADVAQEVMSQVIRSITTFEYQPAKGRFRDWLGAVVRSKVSRWHRKKSRDPAATAAPETEDLVAETVGPDQDWDEQFNAYVLREAMNCAKPDFDSKNWRAFEMVWLEGKSPAETAAATGLAISAVYVAKSRVLKRLEREVLRISDDINFDLTPH